MSGGGGQVLVGNGDECRMGGDWQNFRQLGGPPVPPGKKPWLNDWLIDWLIDWMIDWLIDWLIDWFFFLSRFLYEHWNMPSTITLKISTSKIQSELHWHKFFLFYKVLLIFFLYADEYDKCRVGLKLKVGWVMQLMLEFWLSVRLRQPKLLSDNLK